MESSPSSTWRTPTVRWMGGRASGGWLSYPCGDRRRDERRTPARRRDVPSPTSDWPPAQDTQPYGVKDHLSPGISCSSEAIASTFDYDLERLNQTMVSSARIPIADKHCSAALYWYRLTIQEGIARRNMKMRKSTQTGVLAKSGVLTEKDKIAQNHILAIKCTNN